MAIEARCVLCNFEVEKCDGLDACPNCGTKSIPLDPKADVTIKVNWQELRTLCIWAERWAIERVEKDPQSLTGRGLVYAIAERLHGQFPDYAPLTFAGEIGKLREDGFDVKTNIPGI